MLALVAQFNWELEQMNVATAFFHCELEDDIYIKQPHGFAAAGNDKELVCKLKK